MSGPTNKAGFTPPWAGKYERSYNYAAIKRGIQARPLLEKALPRGRSLTWFDGASGTGKFLAGFIKGALPAIERDAPVKKVITSDINVKALAWQCLQNEWNGPAVSLPADLRNIPLKDGSVDLMTFTNALEHLNAAERKDALSESRRILDADGTLYVAGPIKSKWSVIEFYFMKIFGLLPKGSIDTRGDADHEEWFTREKLLNELKQAGFKPVSEDYYIYGSIKPYWRIKIGGMLQSLMPFSLRKFFGHGAMFVLKKEG